MVVEPGVSCQQSISVLDQYLCAPKPSEKHFLDVSSTTPPPKPSSESVSIEISCFESVMSCNSNIQTTVIESSSKKFVPSMRSGSHTDIGYRKSNEDEHICIDDLSAHLGYLFGCPLPSAFYAVFDGHGGSNAAAVFVKENATKLFFEDANLPQTSEIDDWFLEKLEGCHHEAFLLADQALAREPSVPDSCGTTALTALVIGRHLMVANAGDCRAVLCRKGVAVQMSQDHRPSYAPERRRVVELGGYFDKDDYLNGELAVTRALGDWYLKDPLELASPLTAKPEVQRMMLTEDDEFLVVACDGIWDVMSNEDVVSLVRRALTRHDDPQKCARELVNKALLNASDNLTAIVVCFTPPICRESKTQRPRLRCSSLSEEGKNRLRSLLEGN